MKNWIEEAMDTLSQRDRAKNQPDMNAIVSQAMYARSIAEAAIAQALASERQAAALERIAAALERADNLSKMFGGES